MALRLTLTAQAEGKLSCGLREKRNRTDTNTSSAVVGFVTATVVDVSRAAVLGDDVDHAGSADGLHVRHLRGH